MGKEQDRARFARQRVWATIAHVFAVDRGTSPVDHHGADIQIAADIAFDKVIETRHITDDEGVNVEYGHVADYAAASTLYGFALGYETRRREEEGRHGIASE